MDPVDPHHIDADAYPDSDPITHFSPHLDSPMPLQWPFKASTFSLSCESGSCSSLWSGSGFSFPFWCGSWSSFTKWSGSGSATLVGPSLSCMQSHSPLCIIKYCRWWTLAVRRSHHPWAQAINWDSHEDKFLVPHWGDKVNSGLGLSYRPARLLRLAVQYSKHMPESTMSPNQGLWIWLLGQREKLRLVPLFWIWSLIGRDKTLFT